MSSVDITGKLPLGRQGPYLPASGEEDGKTTVAERRRVKLGWIVTFSLVLALLGLLGWGLYKSSTGPRASGLAPDFTIQSYSGQKVTLLQLRGKVVIVNFWASWLSLIHIS